MFDHIVYQLALCAHISTYHCTIYVILLYMKTAKCKRSGLGSWHIETINLVESRAFHKKIYNRTKLLTYYVPSSPGLNENQRWCLQLTLKASKANFFFYFLTWVLALMLSSNYYIYNAITYHEGEVDTIIRHNHSPN